MFHDGFPVATHHPALRLPRVIFPGMTPVALPPGALPTPFRPAALAGNPHLQTVAGKFLRPALELPLRRERWDTPDGDFLDLDFGPDPDAGRPLVVVLHGLEGNTRRRYMLCTYDALVARGVAAVGLNFRTCSGEPNRRARSYHSGETGDLGFVLDTLRERFPGRTLGAVGFSLGGNVLLKYLGEEGDAAIPDAAVAISVPYDLSVGADHLERGRMAKVYTKYFLDSLIRKVEEKAHLLTDHVDAGRLGEVRTIREFDERLTAPLHGFAGAEDYYRRSSSAGFVGAIRRPTLLLHAADDPFLPWSEVPRSGIEGNEWLHPSVTARGGHVGFIRGSLRRPRFWAEESAARFMAVTLASTLRTP